MRIERSRSALVGGLVLAAAVVAAGCTREVASGESAASAVGSSALELDCVATQTAGTTFRVSPAFGGIMLEGELTAPEGGSLFACSTPAADAGASSLIAVCNERPGAAHPGRYTVEVTREGSVYAATLIRGEDAGAREAFTCTRPGAGGTTLTFEDVQPTLKNVCGRCHGPTWTTLEKVEADRTTLISVISSGAMPRGAPAGWNSQGEGKALLDWLRATAQ